MIHIIEFSNTSSDGETTNDKKSKFALLVKRNSLLYSTFLMVKFNENGLHMEYEH